jgi:hypothetical protein
MSLEAYKVSYEGRENESFKNALLDCLIVPAYEQAKSYAILSEDPNVLDMRSVHQYEADGPFVAYTVYAAKSDPRLDILGAVYTKPTDITYQEAQSLMAELASKPGINIEIIERLAGYTPNEFIDAADITYLTKSYYQIDLIDRTIEITAELGYMLDGTYILASGANTELDEERQMVFGYDEVVDIVRALHALALIDEQQVKAFLNAF